MDYLESLQSEGVFHSHGRFTLDFAASRQRYEKLARTDKGGFLRLALQSVVASGVGALNIQASTSDCRLEAELPWGREELQHLWSFLQGNQDEFLSPALQYAKLALILTSCRADLAVRLQGLYVDAQGPRWEENSRPGWRFERIGARPESNQTVLWDLLSPVLSLAWPELLEFRADLRQLPLEVRLNGNLVREGGGFNLDFSVAEVLRVAFVHPEPARNTLRLTLAHPPRPLAWIAPVTMLCLDPAGGRLELPRGDSLLCQAWARIYQGDVNQEDDVLAGARLRLIKHGFPLQVAQVIPKQAAVGVDACELLTDLSGRKPLRDEALRGAVVQAREWLRLAAEAGLGVVKEAPRWQSFLQGSRLEALQRLLRSLQGDREKFLARL